MCFKFLIVSILFYTEVRKILTNISKVKGCEALSEWIQPCVNHLYWCAVTTPSGDGNIILAKFKSFLSHIRDKHTALDDPIFLINVPIQISLKEGNGLKKVDHINKRSYFFSKLIETKQRYISCQLSCLLNTCCLKLFLNCILSLSYKLYVTGSLYNKTFSCQPTIRFHNFCTLYYRFRCT